MENHAVPGSSGVWEMDLLLALPLELVALAAWGRCWLGSADGAALAAGSSPSTVPVIPFVLGIG